MLNNNTHHRKSRFNCTVITKINYAITQFQSQFQIQTFTFLDIMYSSPTTCPNKNQPYHFSPTQAEEPAALSQQYVSPAPLSQASSTPQHPCPTA